jgi:predicted esterase YcpF (UPF0227 family)
VTARVIYLHGFNSSPDSRKARQLAAYMQSQRLGERFGCPALPHRPSAAVAAVESLLGSEPQAVCFVGSSLGGFYATHFAERYGARAVLINPAIDPHIGLRSYLGQQQNLYSGERYELTENHLAEWQALNALPTRRENYLLLLETGDEVLDYRVAMKRYAGARQVVVEGGDHTLQSFEDHLPRLLAFAGLMSA